MPIKPDAGRLLVCLGLGACSPPASTRPPPGDGLSPRVRLGDDLGIRVEPVDGPAWPMARLLARSVAESLQEIDLSATTDRRAAAAQVIPWLGRGTFRESHLQAMGTLISSAPSRDEKPGMVVFISRSAPDAAERSNT
ncbi:MAG TPA: hypothetical protein QF509_07140 [Rhodospirillales bacterium]|nr:hypothetical protein [Rhodospirillales bacterium]